LQALTIVKEAAGNVVVGRLAERVRESVEQGESITGPLHGSNIFPVMVVGMIDVGEQTGALPEMLNRIADNYDEEVDNAVESMTSLLEPIMIVFLGVMVGCIVVAMFLPIINFSPDGNQEGSL
jgi:type IV pilus assembly protein PilC